MTGATDRRKGRNLRRRRAMLWSAVIILVGAIALPGVSYLLIAEDAEAQAAGNDNPRANYWRAVREGNIGYSAVSGQETNVLIQGEAQNWRALRNGPMIYYGGWAIFLTLIALVVFYTTRGRIDIEGGRAGRTVPRWSALQRSVHWFTAISFIVLAITGLSLLFGKVFLIPVLGLKAFSVWAGFAKDLHNALGPLFSVGVAWMIVSWVGDNIPNKVDLEWFRKGGGIVGKAHPSAGRLNGGEKIWFWIIATVGVAVIVSGFILDFPNYGQTRGTMQLANLIHGSLSLVWFCVFLGHAYIGTAGTEGALEGMTRGKVDVNWAKQHHDLWYEELKAAGVEETVEEVGPPARGQPST